ncbi:MAG TPA: hypothetical protein DHV20_08765 [Brochothrix thermosphacta]|nr:hypothetical protein [Brochothrix thermosphacta]
MAIEQGTPNSANSSRGSSCKAQQVQCYHGYKAKLQTCKHTKNKGQQFYSCPVWKVI